MEPNHKVIGKLAPEEVEAMRTLLTEKEAIPGIISAAMDHARDQLASVMVREKEWWKKVTERYGITPNDNLFCNGQKGELCEYLPDPLEEAEALANGTQAP